VSDRDVRIWFRLENSVPDQPDLAGTFAYKSASVGQKDKRPGNIKVFDPDPDLYIFAVGQENIFNSLGFVSDCLREQERHRQQEKGKKEDKIFFHISSITARLSNEKQSGS
jgi:hypothetical protein